MQSPPVYQCRLKEVEPATKRKREEPLLGDTVPDGSLTFNNDFVSFSQHIKRPAAGKELQVYTSTVSVCVAALLQCEGMQIQQCHTAHRQDVIIVIVPLSTVLKLPVLKDLWEVTVPQHESENVFPGQGAAESSCAMRATSHTVPFTPPVAIWALVSLILVLEDKVNLWSLFGNVDTDPRLAAHTMLVRSLAECIPALTACFHNNN